MTGRFPAVPVHKMPGTLLGMYTDRLRTFERLSRQRPGGVRIPMPNRDVIVASSADAMRHVLVENASNYHKGLGQAEARDLIGEGILTGEGDAWRTQRRSLVKQLKARRVRAFVPEVVAHAEQVAADLSHEAWREVEVSELIADYTMRCLATVLDLRLPSSNGDVFAAFDDIQDEAMFQAVTMGVVPSRLRPRRRREVQEAQRVLRRAAARARGKLSVAGLDDQPWTGVDGLVSLFLAGYETTSSTLAWSVRYLARRPCLQEAVAAEGRQILCRDEVSQEDLDSLEVSREVFEETLRLHPPVWLISRRALTDDTVDGREVSQGDDVVFCIHGAGEQERRFRPGTSTEGTIPFGMGPRACPGSHLANTEALIWLAVTTAEVEWDLPPGEQVSVAARMSQSIAGGLNCRVRRRP